MEIKLVRKHIIFKGRVQGVGFRYFCYTEANKMNLTGYVRNLYDGNVEMEVQGDYRDVEMYVFRIKQGDYFIRVGCYYDSTSQLHQNLKAHSMV